MDTQKLTTVTVKVPYHGSGNVIRQNPVQMDIFKDNFYFKAVPLINEDERRVANLPPELFFEYKDGKVISNRGNRDGNQHVLESIVDLLKQQGSV